MAIMRYLYRAWAALALCAPSITALPCGEELVLLSNQNPISFGIPNALYGPGWDPQNAVDQIHQTMINRGFHDALELAKLGADATKDWKKSHRLFGQYFGTFRRSEVEIVNKVFTSLMDSAGGGASLLLSNVFFSKVDVGQNCSTVNHYLQPISQPPSSLIHICDPKGYQVSELHTGSKSCSDLGDTVGETLMDTFARQILSDFLHHPAVGIAVDGIRQPIVDKEVDYDERSVVAHGPFFTRVLAGESRQNVLLNADNYAWFAQEVYWESFCKHTFNPPHPPDDLLYELTGCL